MASEERRLGAATEGAEERSVFEPPGAGRLVGGGDLGRSTGGGYTERLTGGGTSGNERLTAATGVVLLVLLAVIGVTILRLRELLWVHLFVGMLLIGPVLLKMTSTGYRFARYYTSNPAYRRKGPPAAPLRLLAPFVVISTVVVMGSGVASAVRGTELARHAVPDPQAELLRLARLHRAARARTPSGSPGYAARRLSSQLGTVQPRAGSGRACAVTRRRTRRRPGPGRARHSSVRSMATRTSSLRRTRVRTL